MSFPSPNTPHPILLPDGTVHEGTVFLNAVIDHPQIAVGDYSYASSFDPPADWAARLAPYLMAFSPETLTIGRFCQIADRVTFITSSANHRYDGFSSFPFAAFSGGDWDGRPSFPDPGPDTVVGHDVWIGNGATILPGARLGSGVIVGAGAVVGGTIPPYTIVAGTPAKVLRLRQPPEIAERLIALAWWDWPHDRLRQNLNDFRRLEVTEFLDKYEAVGE